MTRIFVLDDFRSDREMLAAIFRSSYDVRCAADLEEAAHVFDNWWPDVALVDAIFPRSRKGAPTFLAEAFLDLVDSKRAAYPHMPQVIIVSGQNDAAKRFNEVHQWLQFGRIADVIPKSTADMGADFFRAVVQLRVEMLLDRQRWRAIQRGAESASEWLQQLGIMTCSPRMLALKDDLIAAARSSACVLLSGPTGCGKELFARAIHALARPGKPFIEENCSAISPELFEAEMFGIEGKDPNHPVFPKRLGLLAAAGAGTLHLDEIQDLDYRHQAKLRHVLQERKFRPVGASADVQFLAKVVTATNKDLRQCVEERTFREDLYFRVAAFKIQIPALVDRQEDIPYLAEHFISCFVQDRRSAGCDCPSLRMNPKCLGLLSSYHWAGNVRELKSVIEKAAEYATLTSSASSVEAEITPELLVKCAPELGGVPPRIFEQDTQLALSGLGAQHWSDLDETRAAEIERAIEARLSEHGKFQFEAMRRALAARDQHKQDPAAIHCLKALLYLLLRTDHRTSIQELLPILGLSAWAQRKKVLMVLAGADPACSGYSLVKLPTPGARIDAALLLGIPAAEPLQAGSAGGANS